jgi:AhpD family alkylhydroperoxidase
MDIEEGGMGEATVQERVDYAKLAPGTIMAMRALDQYVARSGLEPGLLDLVKIRASQLNGCAYCVDMHTQDARARGEGEQRLYALSVWRETPFFTEPERAALAWTEVITLLSGHRVTDELYQAVLQHFNEKQLVDLTMAIIAINGWNRLSVAFRTVPGTYRPLRIANRPPPSHNR